MVGGGGGSQAWLWSELGALPAGLDVKNAPVWMPYGVLTGGQHGCAIRGKTQISRFHLEEVGRPDSAIRLSYRLSW